ncbi:hypothetical protein QF049_005580 [Paenibacillus sp. W4I10]|nr:hypothetical protein [Paenibacillus sp. W4I10]
MVTAFPLFIIVKHILPWMKYINPFNVTNFMMYFYHNAKNLSMEHGLIHPLNSTKEAEFRLKMLSIFQYVILLQIFKVTIVI